MPLSRYIETVVRRTRPLRPVVRYACAAAIVGATFGFRQSLTWIWPTGQLFLTYTFAVLVCACLFGRGPALFSIGFSAALVSYFYLPPLHSLRVGSPQHIAGLMLFALVGTAQTFVVETLVHAMENLRAAERRAALLLHEFRHRSRNDLQSLTGLMLLRARGAKAEEAKEMLREAAAHARSLARVHTRLVAADRSSSIEASVDTREFLAGLAEDLMKTGAGDGLRPIGLIVDAEAHTLPGERAVPLGLVLNECVTNCLKYAFPDDRSGTVHIRFTREGAACAADSFVLSITDDGIGIGAAAPGFGTRLLRALAAQLRGTFERHPGPDGVGTQAAMRFPVASPGYTSTPLD